MTLSKKLHLTRLFARLEEVYGDRPGLSAPAQITQYDLPTAPPKEGQPRLPRHDVRQTVRLVREAQLMSRESSSASYVQ